jgi:hypothetical protein
MTARKSALLLLLNLALLGVFAAASYYGYLTFLWVTDASKLSFVILAVYFVAAGFLSFGKHSEAVVQEIADLLPGVALIGTVAGIILVLSALAHVSVSGGSDFKQLIGPILIGAGTSFQPTLLGVSAAVLLRFQLMFAGGRAA